jgi:hypothetical protein
LHAAAFTDVVVADTAPAEAVADAFVDVYSRAADAAAGPTADRLRIRVKALREERHRAVPYVREAIREFAQLARLWPRLVSGLDVVAGWGMRARRSGRLLLVQSYLLFKSWKAEESTSTMLI